MATVKVKDLGLFLTIATLRHSREIPYTASIIHVPTFFSVVNSLHSQKKLFPLVTSSDYLYSL